VAACNFLKNQLVDVVAFMENIAGGWVGWGECGRGEGGGGEGKPCNLLPWWHCVALLNRARLLHSCVLFLPFLPPSLHHAVNQGQLPCVHLLPPSPPSHGPPCRQGPRKLRC
jgi:hypothetical protein